MEGIYHTKESLLSHLQSTQILKKSPKELRTIRNEIHAEFNKIINEIMTKRKTKRDKNKKISRPVYYISNSSDSGEE